MTPSQSPSHRDPITRSVHNRRPSLTQLRRLENALVSAQDSMAAAVQDTRDLAEASESHLLTLAALRLGAAVTLIHDAREALTTARAVFR